MNKLVIMAVLGCGFLSACTTVTKTAATHTLAGDVLTTPTVADVKVSPQKMQKTVEWEFSPFDLLTLSERKANLMADILKESGGDVLLEPNSTFIRSPFGKRSLTVSGYSARLSNFRKADEKDLKLLSAGLGETKCPVYNLTSPTRPTSPLERMENVEQVKPSKANKMQWIWRGGIGHGTFAGSNYSDIKESSGKAVYQTTIEFNKPFGRTNLYWGMSLGLGSRAYEYPRTEWGYYGYWGEFYSNPGTQHFYAHTVQLSPFLIGYKLQLTNGLTLDPQVGIYGTVDYAGKARFESIHREVESSVWSYSSSGHVDAGLNLGLNLWFGDKYTAGVQWQRGFFPHDGDFDLGGGASNLLFRFGVAF